MTSGVPRIGIRVPQYGGTWDDIARTAVLLDGSGVDALWVNDHFQSPGREKTDATFDAFTTLGALAALTHRVRLGIAVMSASYRPAQVATKMATVLDAISGGRLIVGLGAGSDRDEHRAYGIPFGTPSERTAGVRHTLAVMDAMWASPDGATRQKVYSATTGSGRPASRADARAISTRPASSGGPLQAATIPSA